MKKFRTNDGKSYNLPIIAVFYYGGDFDGRDQKLKDAFFQAVAETYGYGYGLYFGDAIDVDSNEANSSYNGGITFLKAAAYPFGDDAINDYKRRWDEVVEKYPDPDFRKELVKMDNELAKTPAPFPTLALVNYGVVDKRLRNDADIDHTKVLGNIVKKYNSRKPFVDAVYVEAAFTGSDAYNPQEFPAELAGVPCKMFSTPEQLHDMLLKDENFRIEKFNPTNKDK